jgi:hypothetical protein
VDLTIAQSKKIITECSCKKLGAKDHPPLYSLMLEGHEVKSKEVSSCTHKEDVPESNMVIICTPIFEWYVIRCGSKNGHQKGTMCLRD